MSLGGKQRNTNQNDSAIVAGTPNRKHTEIMMLEKKKQLAKKQKEFEQKLVEDVQ